MKIVLYFSALFGLFWLIQGVLSHRDPATKRNAAKHVNANKGRGEYLSPESSNVHDKVLIKSESPLRGRKIHQTAWSQEESDGENDHEGTKQDQKEDTGLENSWTLENILKYLTSLVYPIEETDQHDQIWITSELIRDIEAKSNTKNKQKSRKTEENHDEISKYTQKNDKRQQSTYEMSYLEDYYENFHTEQTERDIRNESDELYENSYEDERQINYKTDSKIFGNDKPNHKFQDKYMKTDQSSSSEDNEISDDEDCFDDTDEELTENSGEIQVILKKVTSINNDMEQSNEEKYYKNEQKTISNKKHKDIKNILRRKTEKSDLQTDKQAHKIIVLNGTKFTGQNNKNNKNDGLLETTSIPREESNIELTNTEDKVTENSSEEISIIEQRKFQVDSYANREIVQNINSKNINQNTSVGQDTKDETVDTVIELSTVNSDVLEENTKTNKLKGSKTSFIENIENEVWKTEIEQNEETLITALNNKENIVENTETTSVMKTKSHKQVDSKNSFTENKETASRTDENIKNEVWKTENVQNEETLITTLNNRDNIEENTKTSSVMKTRPHKRVDSKNSFTETKQTTSRNDKNIKNEAWMTEQVQNEETFITNSVDNTAKLSLDEKNINFLEIHPETLTMEAKRESKQTINDETINNPVDVQTVLISTELKNGENQEFNVQNTNSEFKTSEIKIVEERNNEALLQDQASQISAIENNQQNYEYFTKNLDDQVKETRFLSKPDNGYEYVSEGNEFVPLNNNNEEKYVGFSNDNTVVNNYESENKSQFLTESVVQMLQNVDQVDVKQQETFDTILEFLYKRSKNPLILALKENSNATY